MNFQKTLDSMAELKVLRHNVRIANENLRRKAKEAQEREDFHRWRNRFNR
jgi:hypothetical protein